MIELERPTLSDLEYLCAHAAEDDKREWGTTHWGGWSCNTIVATIGLYLEGVAHVFRESDGTPYCASGFYMNSPGVARSWQIGTEGWKRRILPIARVSRQVVSKLLASDGVHRLEAWCPEWATRWPQVIGFEREAVLRRYATDGTDIVIWSKVKE